MKILVIPSWYECNTNPTLGSFFREQSESLARANIEVIVAYPGFNGIRTFGKNEHGIKYYIKNNVHTYRYDTYNYFYDKYPVDIKNRIFKKKLFKLYKMIEKKHGKPDIIHAHSSTLAGYGATKLGEYYNIPVIITEHSSAFLHGKIKRESKKFISYSLDHCDKLISVSKGLKEKLEIYTIKNDIIVIPNIVDTEKFKILNRKKNNKFNFLTVCYLSHNKGIDTLLKSFSKAFKGNRNITLRIGGDGRELDNLKKLSKELEIESQVEFLGALSREQVLENMRKSDCFVLPSRFETFGVVLIEALSCGVPVISTRTSGPLDIVNNKNGILVEIDNIQELSNALLEIVTKIEEYNPIKIRQECISRYSEDTVIDKLIKLYLDVIMSRRKND